MKERAFVWLNAGEVGPILEQAGWGQVERQ
jgi:hypothetical protein